MKITTVSELLAIYKSREIPDKVILPQVPCSDEQMMDLLPHIIWARYSDVFSDRQDIINKYGAHCIVANNWVQMLAEWIGTRTVLSVASGHGCLEFALTSFGVTVFATDKKEKKDGTWDDEFDWMDIEKSLVNQAIINHQSADILLLSWPNYNESLAYDALIQWRSIKSDAPIIYIGENKGGCTGNDLFYDTAEEIKDKKIDAINAIFPRFPFVFDYIQLYK